MKMEISTVNNGGGKGSLNVFAQLAEPKVKDGIWIKTERTVAIGGYTKLKDIPYEFYNGSVVAIGTDIYLFGGPNSSKYTYKYDTLANTYTRLADILDSFYERTVALVGTDVYLFGGNSSSNSYKYAYKYNTLANTYTRIKTIPYSFADGAVATVGTDVYLFGGSGRKKNSIQI